MYQSERQRPHHRLGRSWRAHSWPPKRRRGPEAPNQAPPSAAAAAPLRL